MVKVYIKHCPLYCSDRRPFLEKHLHDRGFTDLIWMTKYNKHHLFIEWLHQHNTHMSREGLSGAIKFYECLVSFLEDESAGEHAVFCDDDVVFIEGAKDIIENLPPYPYINLSLGVSFHRLPTNTLYENTTFNNGGSEAMRISREFAKFLVDNFDLRVGGDHVFTGALLYNNKKLYVCPIAQQTSILTKTEKCTYSTTDKNILENYIFNFKPTNIKYLNIWEESGLPREDNSETMKKLVEEDFFTRYGQKINIQNWNYILNRASAILSQIGEGGEL